MIYTMREDVLTQTTKEKEKKISNKTNENEGKDEKK